MRSCVYCGKSLEKGEKCNCSQSANARREKSKSESFDGAAKDSEHKSEFGGHNSNTYQTGYTKNNKTSFKEKLNQRKQRRQNRKAAKRMNRESFHDVTSGLKGFIREFMRDPIIAVSNCSALSKWHIILLVVLQGLGLSICGYFAYARVFIPLINSVVPIAYGIKNLISTAIFGTVAISAGLFILFGIFYAINRAILKCRTNFWIFCERLSAAIIPMTVLSIVGALINFFSVYAMVMIILVSLIFTIILTYEALRAEWSFLKPSRCMYLTGLGYFIFFIICFNIFRVI